LTINAVSDPEKESTNAARDLEDAVIVEVSHMVPPVFQVDSPEAANWLVRKVVEAREYRRRVNVWAEAEASRAEKEEAHLMRLFGNQLEQWVAHELLLLGRKRRSLDLPAGRVGFRTTPMSLSVMEEPSVIAWAKLNCPAAVVTSTVERLLKTPLTEYLQNTGDAPPSTQVEPSRDKFFIK
jgi:hypothetical protein